MGVSRTHDLNSYDGYRSSEVELDVDGYVNNAYVDIQSQTDGLLNSITGYLEDALEGIVSFSPYSPNPPELKPDLERVHTPYTGMTIPTLPANLFSPISVADAPLPDKVGAIGTLPVGEVPQYGGTEYYPAFPPAPTIGSVEDPGDFETDVEVILPPPLDLEPVDAPALQPILIPTVPTLSIPEWDTPAPDFSSTRPPDGQFHYTEIPYTSDLLNDTNALIKQMQAGGVGIPDYIWDTIWGKSADQITKAGDKQIDEINKEWSGRGFSLPQGAQVGQVLEIRQSILEQQSMSSRENAITYAAEEVKNLQFAVQQGIAFETMRGQWYQAERDRAFKMAENVLSAIYKNFEADMAYNNLILQQYSAEAQVYKTLIDAEIARLETVKLEIQTQELVLKANDTLLKQYEIDIKALELNIQEYNASIAAAGIMYEGLKAEVSVYSEEIKAYVARIEAQTQKTAIYKETVAAEGIKVDAYETSVRAYGESVKAFGIKVDANSKAAQTQVSIEELGISSYDSRIKGYQSELAAKSDVQKSNVEYYNAYITANSALIEDNKTATSTVIESDKNRIQFSQVENESSRAAAELASRASEASAKIHVDTNTSLAQINASLAGSMFSSLNIGANISESVSGSVSSSSAVSYFGGDV